MNYRQSRKLENIALASGAVLSIIGALFDWEPLVWLGAAVMIAGIAQAFFFCRCPNCGESLDLRGSLPSYCPACGIRLGEEKEE